jgi:O-antigen ligase
MNASVPALGSPRNIRGLLVGLGILALTWELCVWISAGNDQMLSLVGMLCALVGITVYILHDWRSGFYLFLAWLLLEDLPRKFLGNNMMIYFAKDFLVGVTYISCLIARRRRQFETFRPPFWIPLSLFFWLALIQVFNLSSSSLLFGALGMQLYFYYVPLMFVSYALIRNPEDLRRFLVFSALFALVISCVGVIQSTVDINFLNPVKLAPELADLGSLKRMSPVTHQMILVPTGVFVSSGRFGEYLIIAWILAMATASYVLLSRRRGAIYAFLAIAAVSAATLLSGSRATIIIVAASALIMTAALLWGVPWRWGQGRRMAKALRYALVAAGAALILLLQFAPETFGANWAFFSETMSPTGAGSELHYRVVEYPLINLKLAFEHENWMFGYGTGTDSLGVQYVAEVLHTPRHYDVENGIGTLIVEMGILGPILWLAWVFALLLAAWRIVRRLRQTPYLPVAFGIFWYALMLLTVLTYISMNAYQNFVLNAYLWILVGILFRLPHLAQLPQQVSAPDSRRVEPTRRFVATYARR